MDDNRIFWIFTFGCGQQHEGHYVRLFGTWAEAREKMVDMYGTAWAFQYSEYEYNRFFELHPEVPRETPLEEGQKV